MERDPGLPTVFLARVVDFVSGQSFPAAKAAVIARARHANTASDIYAVLLEIPDRTYESTEDLQRAVAERRVASET